MDVSATFGRLFDQVISGTSNYSGTIPSNRFAIIQAGQSGTSGLISIVVGSNTFTTNAETKSGSVAAFAKEGESVSITFSGSTSPGYTITLLYAVTLP